MTTPAPLNYLLRNIPEDLWTRFRARSEAEGISMRTLIFLLIEAFLDGKIVVTMKRT